MIFKIIDDKEANKFEKFFKNYPVKRKEIMKNTQFKAQNTFGDIISKDSISPEQTTKLNKILAKVLWIWVFV